MKRSSLTLISATTRAHTSMGLTWELWNQWRQVEVTFRRSTREWRTAVIKGCKRGSQVWWKLKSMGVSWSSSRLINSLVWTDASWGPWTTRTKENPPPLLTEWHQPCKTLVLLPVCIGTSTSQQLKVTVDPPRWTEILLLALLTKSLTL